MPDAPTLVHSSDGVRVAVHDLGGEGPPLLLLHATGFCGLAYSALGRAAAERFRVRAVDLRGHGVAGRPREGRFDWDRIADDLLAVLEWLGDGAPAVFGHSLGGGIALLAAARRPGALAAAYLYEPIVVPPGFERLQGSSALSQAARRRRAAFPSRAEALLRYAGRPPLDVLQAGVLADYVEHGFEAGEGGEVRLRCLPEDEAAVFEAPGKPTFDLLGSVSMPVVVAAGGTAGEWTPALLAPEVVERLPHGRLELHPALGHLGPLENPREVAAALLAALAGDAGASR